MRHGSWLVLGGLCGVSLAQSAMAQSLLTYTVDRRRCSAAVFGNGSGNSWDDLRGVALAGDYQGGSSTTMTNELNETCTGTSSQRSWTDGRSMTFRSNTSASVLPPVMVTSARSEGLSRFELEFSTTQALVFTLSGVMGEAGFAGSEVTFTLQRLGTSGAVLQFTNSGEAMQSVSRTGEMPAGNYRIECLTRAKSETVRCGVAVEGSAHSDLVLSVAVPEPVVAPPSTPLVATPPAPPAASQPVPPASNSRERLRGDARRGGSSNAGRSPTPVVTPAAPSNTPPAAPSAPQAGGGTGSSSAQAPSVPSSSRERLRGNARRR